MTALMQEDGNLGRSNTTEDLAPSRRGLFLAYNCFGKPFLFWDKVFVPVKERLGNAMNCIHYSMYCHVHT